MILPYTIRVYLFTTYVAALDNKALSLSKLGNYTGAIEYLDKTLAVNPKHENALQYNKGSQSK
jgi:tetratricopeptide (TPR) repeat protein